jgi:hypothetical protein
MFDVQRSLVSFSIKLAAFFRPAAGLSSEICLLTSNN